MMCFNDLQLSISCFSLSLPLSHPTFQTHCYKSTNTTSMKLTDYVSSQETTSTPNIYILSLNLLKPSHVVVSLHQGCIIIGEGRFLFPRHCFHADSLDAAVTMYMKPATSNSKHEWLLQANDIRVLSYVCAWVFKPIGGGTLSSNFCDLRCSMIIHIPHKQFLFSLASYPIILQDFFTPGNQFRLAILDLGTSPIVNPWLIHHVEHAVVAMVEALTLKKTGKKDNRT
jgi:hypothetical protein